MWDPTSTNGEGVMCLICTCSPPYSMRHFGSSLASDSIGTLKLSEFAREQSHDGWSTGKFSCEFPKTKPLGHGRGPKRTISCYGGVELGMWWGPGSGCDNLVSEPLCLSVRICRQGCRDPLKWGGLWDPTSTNEEGGWCALYVHAPLHITLGFLGAHWLRIPSELRS